MKFTVRGRLLGQAVEATWEGDGSGRYDLTGSPSLCAAAETLAYLDTHLARAHPSEPTVASLADAEAAAVTLLAAVGEGGSIDGGPDLDLPIPDGAVA